MRVFFFVLWLSLPAYADPSRPFCTTGVSGPKECIRTSHIAFDTCQMIGNLARQNGLSEGFFARLIWQESRFNFNALSPAGAEGIAQFMPGTARLRQLRDSYDPALALEASAIYLAELSTRYGNPGLAAVAYNGGEARADRFVAKKSGLPLETLNYVRIITGQDAQTWRDTPPKAQTMALKPGAPFIPTCLALSKSQRISPLKAPKPKTAPWGVQLASADSRAAAQQRFNLRTRTCRSVVSEQLPEIIRKSPQVKGRQPYYVARLGRSTRAAANVLCAKLRRQNCACAVYKN